MMGGATVPKNGEPCPEYNCAANHEGYCMAGDLDLYAEGVISDPNLKCPPGLEGDDDDAQG